MGLSVATWVGLAAVVVWRRSKMELPTPAGYPDNPTLADSVVLTGPHECGWTCSSRPRLRGEYDAERCPVCGEAPGLAGWLPVGKEMVDVYEREVGPKQVQAAKRVPPPQLQVRQVRLYLDLPLGGHVLGVAHAPIS